MMNQNKSGWKIAVAVGLCVLGLMSAQGVEIARIVSRPLTGDNIKNAGGLASTNNMKASGLDVIAVGTPAYLEVIVTNKTFFHPVADYATYTNRVTTVDPKFVTNVTWTVVSRPAQSTVALASLLTNSPLTNLVTTPIYDYSQGRFAYVPTNFVNGELIGRKYFLPDAEGQYVIAATVAGMHVTTNAGGSLSTNSRSISVTNTITVGTWLGVEGSACEYCHADNGITTNDNVDGWTETAHWDAFTRKIDGHEAFNGVLIATYSSPFKESCYPCHTLGYERGPIIGGITNPALANNGGFDDIMQLYPSWIPPTNNNKGYFPTNWDVMPVALQHKANIQCENCHGPASQHNGNTSKIDISISAGVCGWCHEATNSHVVNFEWNQSLHATGYVYRTDSYCVNCHSGRGFIDRFDGDGKMTRATTNEGISCATCHDPHPDPATGNENMLRTLADVQLGSFTNITAGVPGAVVATITTGGKGKLCMQCHKSRQGAAVNTLSSSGFGTHANPQTDLLSGNNAITYDGLNIPGVQNPHMSVPDTCVHCHMQYLKTDTNPVYSNAWKTAGGHTWRMTTTSGVDIVRACSVCHYTDYFGDSVTNFDFTFRGADYDTNGVIEGVQTEIDNLASNLAMLLPPYQVNAVTVTTAYTTNQLRAAWNYQLVVNDGSRGVHNAKFAAALLQASIADLLAAPLSVQLTTSARSVAESSGIVTVTVTRTGASNVSATVNYATTNGTAIAGSDYTSTTGTLTWTNGAGPTKTFTVPILNDATYEGNETFTVTLSSPTGAPLGSPSSATVTIVDDEVVPVTHRLIMQLPTGELAAWVINTNGVVLSTTNIYAGTMTWQVRDVGDIDNDGVPDLVSQLGSGESACWYMNADGTVDSTVNIYWNRTKLQIVGAGDINRDGVADLILQSKTGVVCWFMNANASIQSTATVIGRTKWQVCGAGDVNKDGTADLIVQSTLGLECWFLNTDGSIASTTRFYSGTTAWVVSGVGDVSGDGVADLILQKTTGEIGYWLLNADGSYRVGSWLDILGTTTAWKVRGVSIDQ